MNLALERTNVAARMAHVLGTLAPQLEARRVTARQEVDSALKMLVYLTDGHRIEQVRGNGLDLRSQCRVIRAVVLLCIKSLDMVSFLFVELWRRIHFIQAVRLRKGSFRGSSRAFSGRHLEKAGPGCLLEGINVSSSQSLCLYATSYSCRGAPTFRLMWSGSVLSSLPQSEAYLPPLPSLFERSLDLPLD